MRPSPVPASTGAADWTGMHGVVVKRILIAGVLLLVAVFVVRGVQPGGGPAAAAEAVDAAPAGCEAFRRAAVSALFDGDPTEVKGQGEEPGAKCTWNVPGSTTGAVLYAQTPNSLDATFPGLTLEQVLRQTRPEPSPPAEVVADLTVNGRPGWSAAMIASPSEAVTRATWIADGKLYSLSMRRTVGGSLEPELADIQTAVVAIDERVRP